MTRFPAKKLLLIYLLIVILVIGITLLSNAYNREFFDGVLVEAHGVLIEFFVFALLIGWIEYKRREESYKYQLLIQLQASTQPIVDAESERIRNLIKELNSNSIKKFSFRSASLKGIDLSDLDFSGSDFSDAKLEDCNFTNANLRDTNFTKSSIKKCNFSEADLFGADLLKATKIEATDIVDAKNIDQAILNNTLIANMAMLQAADSEN